MKITRLKKVRQLKKKTQDEVAKQAKITTRSYRYYESGERVPDVITAQRIALALGTTVEKLFPYKA
ncbi:hypothetical protein B7C51_15635 [Paenibacillus larvae subsp. pulvifaciens]|uniref:HTH cro/C1-type domain-containing protein n=1 Tax=Paenibacillus larvae subsp. pulvifaciens TaxID=1477 RepID=A0A1V0UUU3_9BACL|nr:helix-turn-helix transcriptional regulator [Paenibacillus larvae]ARF68921.1 hypothetical protein B7C51_15635 [Paenibacillus larvae subsp. pulvifaciens]